MEAKLIIKDGRANATVYVDGSIFTASDSHPNWDGIIDAVEGKVEVANWKHLFSIREAIAAQFLHLSERVAVANDTLYFDGEPQDDSLATQTIRVWKEGGNFQGLVAFMENIASNPQEHSRQQLYDWLRNHNFTITQDGMIVGYKGCASDGVGGFCSTTSGAAYVNGTHHSGHIPNAIGDVVEMPRNQVDHDPSSACSSGLHVGVYQYAQDYARNGGALLEVHVNPRDVVSVPTDGGGAKIRVCRYKVAGLSEQERPEAMLVESEDWYCGLCGELTPRDDGDLCEDCDEATGVCEECFDDVYDDDSDLCASCIEDAYAASLYEPCDDPACCPQTEQEYHDQGAKVVPDYVTPSAKRFNELAAKAKSQKKGLTALAVKQGWFLSGLDPRNRKDWKAPKK